MIELKKRKAAHTFAGREAALYRDIEESLSQVDITEGEYQQVEAILDTLLRVFQLDEDEFRVFAPIVLNAWSEAFNRPELRFELSRRLSHKETIELSQSISSLEEMLKDQMAEEYELLSEAKVEFLNSLFMLLNNFALDVGKERDTVILGVSLEKGAKQPNYAHSGDSGMDLFSMQEYTIAPGETAMVHTGVTFSIPKGYEVQIRNKSGLAAKTKLRVANTPGTIDQSYTGEIIVIVENVESPIQKLEIDQDGKVTNIEYGKSFTIGAGEKVAQAVLCKVATAHLHKIDSLELDTTTRGKDGFGSTGLE